MKHAMIPKYDVYVSLDYGLCNWKWKYMCIWFIRIRHITSFDYPVVTLVKLYVLDDLCMERCIYSIYFDSCRRKLLLFHTEQKY